MSSSPRGDGVRRGSVLMASGSLVSRVLGLVRASMLLALFGVLSGGAGDAFQVAQTLPTTVYMIIGAGVINAVFVPQLTKAAEREDGGAFVDRLVTLSLLVLGGTTLLSLPLAPLLVKIFASDSWSPELFGLSVRFAVVMLPAIFFYGLYAVLGQVLGAQGRFGAYGWAPALANVVWLVGLGASFVLVRGDAHDPASWPPGMVLLLGGSLTVGVALQALILLVPLLRSGWRYQPRFGFRGHGLGTTGRVAGWTIGGIVVTQAGLAVASRVLTGAEGAGVGRVGYDQAFFIFMTPHGLITVSLATALFTYLAQAATKNDLVGVRGHVRKGLRLIGVAIIPTTIAGVALAHAGMAVVFAGNTLEATRALGDVFMVLVLALLPYGVLFLVQRAFYAFEDARTPFVLTAVAAAVFAGGSLVAAVVLPLPLRAVGVAAAATLSDVVAAWLGLRWVGARLGGMRLVDVYEAWTKALFAALVAGLGTLAVVWLFQTLVGGRVGEILTLVVGGLVFVALYVVGGRSLRIPELETLLAPVLRRLPGARAAAADRD